MTVDVVAVKKQLDDAIKQLLAERDAIDKQLAEIGHKSAPRPRRGRPVGSRNRKLGDAVTNASEAA